MEGLVWTSSPRLEGAMLPCCGMASVLEGCRVCRLVSLCGCIAVLMVNICRARNHAALGLNGALA
jgi:hypothetical protein